MNLGWFRRVCPLHFSRTNRVASHLCGRHTALAVVIIIFKLSMLYFCGTVGLSLCYNACCVNSLTNLSIPQAMVMGAFIFCHKTQAKRLNR